MSHDHLSDAIGIDRSYQEVDKSLATAELRPAAEAFVANMDRSVAIAESFLLSVGLTAWHDLNRQNLALLSLAQDQGVPFTRGGSPVTLEQLLADRDELLT